MRKRRKESNEEREKEERKEERDRKKIYSGGRVLTDEVGNDNKSKMEGAKTTRRPRECRYCCFRLLTSS